MEISFLLNSKDRNRYSVFLHAVDEIIITKTEVCKLLLSLAVSVISIALYKIESYLSKYFNIE